jgi:hypothetical protein
LRGPEGKKDHEDCQGDPEKRGTRSIEGLEGKRDQKDCQGYLQQKRGTRRIERSRR